MIEFMEGENQGYEQSTTAITDNTTPVADLPRTVSEQALTGAENSRTIAEASPTVGEAPIPHPQSSSFNPQKHTLDLRHILSLFKTAGIQRTPRAIQRYCQQGKLDAQRHPTQKIYLATPESVESLIASFKEIDERHSNSLFRATATGNTDSNAPSSEQAQNRREPSMKDGEGSPSSSREDVRHSGVGERVKELEQKVEKLEIENQKLQVEERVKDGMITKLMTQIRDDRNYFTEKLTVMSRIAETFKTRLSLAAPKESRELGNEPLDLDAIEAEVIGQSNAFNDDLKTDGMKR